MTNQPTISRIHLVYAVCLPLAVLVGYFWAEPLDWTGLGVLVIVLSMLLVPLLMRWHYPWLLFSWNASISLYFLSGQPYLWMLMAGCSLLFAVLNRATDSRRRFLNVPMVTWPLLFFFGVVVVTGLITGGFGVRALGSGTIGGRGYFYIFFAVVGYFALTSQTVPKKRAVRYLALFFLPGLLAVMSNVTFALGPKYYFLYNLFPPVLAADQARAELSFGDPGAVRITGLYSASLMVGAFLLARFGLRGILDVRRPWRFAVLIFVVVGCLFGGFRSNLILLLLMLASMFFFEGLWRTRLMPVIILFLIFFSVVAAPFASSLPLTVQRTLSFLPLPIDPMVRLGAQGSTEWRVEMWKILLPEVPKYLIKGKGYALSPAELSVVTDAANQGWGSSMEVSLLAGDYHNGPLSVIIPFGIFGVISFCWFLGASIRVLYLNRRYGDPELYYCNTFLLAYFVARIVFFLFIFGALNAELWVFTGAIGLSIALNGGVKHPTQLAERRAEQLAQA